MKTRFKVIDYILHAIFSLLPCVETLEVIEIFVEQYCINCKGIEKNLKKRLYLVYLLGGPLFFWKQGDENFFKTNNFFSVSLSVKTFAPRF